MALAAAALLEDGRLEAMRSERYAGWDAGRGSMIKDATLEKLSELVISEDVRPEPRSGRQERLENLVNAMIAKI